MTDAKTSTLDDEEGSETEQSRLPLYCPFCGKPRHWSI
jgi:hypothetical protein